MLLIAGGFGRLGAAFARACSSRGIEHRRCTRAELDIESPASVASALQTLRPWGVVNAAGLGDIDTAEREPARCLRENATGALHLARACAARSIPVLVFSSSQVFDGELTRPYREPDRVQPLNMLGLSKALAERLLLRLHPRPLIVRTGMLFSAVEPDDFLTAALRALEQGSLVPFIDDMVVSPTYVPDLVDAALDLFIDGERGIWHIANGGELSCEEFMLRAARLAGLNTQYRAPAGTRRMGIAARRPYYSAMESDRGALLPSLDDALSRYIAEVRSTLSSVAA
jgi:dTDP-4-dehydrorhamnose reductase